MTKKIKDIKHIKNKKKKRSKIIKNTSRPKKIVEVSSKSPITRIKKAKGVYRSIRKGTKDAEISVVKPVEIQGTKQAEVKGTKSYISKSKILKGLVGKDIPINIANKLNQKRWKNALNKVGLRTFTNARGELRIASEKRAIYYESLKGKNLADITNIIKRRNADEAKRHLNKQLYSLGKIQIAGRKIFSKALKNAIESVNIERKTETFIKALQDDSTVDRLKIALSPEYQQNLIEGIDWWKNNDCIDNETKRSLAQEHILRSNIVGSQQEGLFDQFGNKFIHSPDSNRVKLVTPGSRSSEFATKDQIENSNEWVQISDSEYNELLRQHGLHITGTTSNARNQFREYLFEKDANEIFNENCRDQKRIWKDVNSREFEGNAKDFNLAYSQNDDYDEETFYNDIKGDYLQIRSEIAKTYQPGYKFEFEGHEYTGEIARKALRSQDLPGTYQKLKYNYGRDHALNIVANLYYGPSKDFSVSSGHINDIFSATPAESFRGAAKNHIINKLGKL